MPVAPARPCPQPGCPQLQPCPQHKRHTRPAVSYAARRQAEPWRKVYATARWATLRERVLAAQPLCRTCDAEGRVTLATVVDHVVPHRGNLALAYDPANLAPLCHRCHSRKTAYEVWHGR